MIEKSKEELENEELSDKLTDEEIQSAIAHLQNLIDTLKVGKSKVEISNNRRIKYYQSELEKVLRIEREQKKPDIQ